LNHHIEYLTRTPAGITAVVTHTSVIDVQDVICDIEHGRATYSAGPTSWDRTRIRAIPFLQGAFLFANWDGSKRNNLHDIALPTANTRPQPGRDLPDVVRRFARISRKLIRSIWV
jgi:hypothetical protein